MTKVDTSREAVEYICSYLSFVDDWAADKAVVAMQALLAERDELRQALEQAAKIVDPAANAKRGLWAENLRRKAAAIRALQSTTTKEEE